jgi:hypothetical protein
MSLSDIGRDAGDVIQYPYRDFIRDAILPQSCLRKLKRAPTTLPGDVCLRKRAAVFRIYVIHSDDLCQSAALGDVAECLYGTVLASVGRAVLAMTISCPVCISHADVGAECVRHSRPRRFNKWPSLSEESSASAVVLASGLQDATKSIAAAHAPAIG